MCAISLRDLIFVSFFSDYQRSSVPSASHTGGYQREYPLRGGTLLVLKGVTNEKEWGSGRWQLIEFGRRPM